jgi:hypothetical protein
VDTHDGPDPSRYLPAPPGLHGLRDEPWTPVGPAGRHAWSLTLPKPPQVRFNPVDPAPGPGL